MWQLPVATLRVEPGETHLWRGLCVPGDVDLRWCEEWLTPGEMERARRFATETLRRRYLQAHSLLHILLGAYTQAGGQRCDLAQQPNGKPYLRAPQLQPSLEFNMSHTGEVVMIALTRGHAVGVDMEMVRPLDDLDGMITTCCSGREGAYLGTLAPDARLRAFYCLWTRKEAWLKLLGVGLGIELTSMDVYESPREVTLLDIAVEEMTGGKFMAALALPAGELPNVKMWEPQWQ